MLAIVELRSGTGCPLVDGVKGGRLPLARCRASYGDAGGWMGGIEV